MNITNEELFTVKRLGHIAIRVKNVDRAKAFGISSQLVDGLDFFKIYDSAAKAINRSRNESSPSLLHIKTKRYFGHFSGDTDSYRSIEEKQKMRRDEDCIKIFREKIILEEISLILP